MNIMLLPATLIVCSKATKQHHHGKRGHGRTVFLFIWLFILTSQHYIIIWWQILVILLNSFNVLNPSQTYAEEYHGTDPPPSVSVVNPHTLWKGPRLTCSLIPSFLHKVVLLLRLNFLPVESQLSAHSLDWNFPLIPDKLNKCDTLLFPCMALSSFNFSGLWLYLFSRVWVTILFHPRWRGFMFLILLVSYLK